MAKKLDAIESGPAGGRIDLWAGLRMQDDVTWAGGGVSAAAKLKNNLSLYADATAGYRRDAFSSGLAVEAIGGLRWRF